VFQNVGWRNWWRIIPDSGKRGDGIHKNSYNQQRVSEGLTLRKQPPEHSGHNLRMYWLKGRKTVLGKQDIVPFLRFVDAPVAQAMPVDEKVADIGRALLDKLGLRYLNLCWKT
jgi:hypothetical protein